jgi:hypothetical protein
MPRYYFDVRNDEACSFDDDGLVLDGLQAALDQATRTLTEHAREVLPRVTRKVLAIEVRDEAKRPLFELRLAFDAVRPR